MKSIQVSTDYPFLFTRSLKNISKQAKFTRDGLAMDNLTYLIIQWGKVEETPPSMHHQII